jgi:predicted ATPase
MLLSLPGAVVLDFDGDGIAEVDYRQTKHFLITRDFLNAPDQFFKHLFAAEPEQEPNR